MKRALKWCIGLALLPMCVSISLTAAAVIGDFGSGFSGLSREAWGFVIGFVLWALLFLTLPRPARTYVLAHELSHAVWAWAFGARIFSLRVSKGGGHVKLSKSNFLITLAPYFFPLYTVCVLLLYAGLSLFYDLAVYRPFWMGAIGLTWSFHVTFTLSALRVIQPDIREQGRLFSYTLIYLLNVAVLCLLLTAVGAPRLQDVGERAATDLAQTAGWLHNVGAVLAEAAGKRLARQ